MNNCECSLAETCNFKPGHFDCAKKLMEMANSRQPRHLYNKNERESISDNLKDLLEELKCEAESLKKELDEGNLCNSCKNPNCNGLTTGNEFNPEYIVLGCKGYTRK